MSFKHRIQKRSVILAGLLLLMPLSVIAAELSPVVPKATAKATKEFGCVGPVVDMRINHMEYLQHQRDDTTRKGIRTKKYSLAECINCHVEPAKEGKPVRFGDDKHFCSTCHNYAAVQVDCFQCHNDQPQTNLGQQSLLEKQHPGNVVLTKQTSLNKETKNDLSSGGAN